MTSSTEYSNYESGTVLLNNRYRFVKNLQNGSFGKVSLALDTKSHINVSIKAIPKVSPTKQLPGERSLSEIARSEIDALDRLNQPSTTLYDNSNICQLLDSFETPNYIVLVLEYCSRGDLYDLIHERSLSNSEILKLATQLKNAIEFAHGQSVYHRDIKPENVLIDHQFNFKLCDWGLATTSKFSEDFNVGTEKYMAPECLLKDRTVDGKYDCTYSDYWSYGITILTAIFGTSPFKQPSNTKSIQSDYNFKNFVLFNNPYILYDIYPSMNSNCFEIFMNLLKVGSEEDDATAFAAKASSRDIKRFLQDLKSNWIYGLTVDDVYEGEDDDEAVASIPHSDVFDMDHDDLQNSSVETKPSSIDGDEFDEADLMFDYKNITPNIPISSPQKQSKPVLGQSAQASMKLPSLVESSIKSSVSWCDLEEEEDWALDTDISLVLDNLHLDAKSGTASANGSKVSFQRDMSPFSKSTSPEHDQIRFIDHEISMNNDAKVINWFDY